MGFFDDLAMGLGIKEKTDDYRERTAQNLESQGNQRGADQVRAQMTGSGSGSSATSSSPRPVYRPEVIAPSGQDVSTMTAAQMSAADKRWDPAIAPTRAQFSPATTKDPYVDMTKGEEMLSRVKNMGLLGIAKKGMDFLAGTKDTDKVMGTVEGKPIYQRENGTYYTYNALGMPYDVASPDTLKEDPAQVARRQQMMMGGGGDNGPVTATDVVEGATDEFTDPCPEGYVYDEEEKMCVVDPTFIPPFPEIDVMPAGPTEVAGNYTQMPGGMTMPGLNPYPQMQSRGLGAANLGPRSEGILQVVAGPQAPRGPAPIPNLTTPQITPQRRV